VRKLGRFTIVLAAGVVFGAACGGASVASGSPSASATGSPAGPAATSTVKPCDLIARSDAEAAVGQALPKTDENVTLGTCGYSATDFAAGVQFTVTTWEAVKTAAQSYAGAKPPTAVNGVGDEALTRGGGSLYVRKGSRGILLVINGPQVDGLPDHGLSRVEDLARTILPKL
jgi:hypothetical protein